ncbi:MAG: SMC family ATPase [Dehalococcoidia bacterium]|nr:SMC family ATPase [Dehalococcoidia bacterium]
MRPLELVVNGFRSFAEETRFDWRDRRLVGIVGPIGSGKSSILDAIAFALYGRTPSSGADTKGLINQRRAVAQVALTFRVEGQAWQVVRAIRNIGAPNHTLYPYDEQTREPDRGAGVSGQKAVTDGVTQLLGLDFDAFRRSVLLAQNRFADFLNATPTERDRVLQGVFNLDRVGAMQVAARDRLHAADLATSTLAHLVAEVAAARTSVLERRTEHQAHAARLASLEALRPAIEQHTRTEREAREQVLSAQRRAVEIDALRSGLPRPEESNHAIDGFAALIETAARAGQAREQAEAAEAHAREGRETALREAGGPERLEAAASALQAQGHARETHADRARQRDAARTALDAARAQAAAAQAVARDAATTAKRTEGALTKAEAAVATADAALHAAERLDFAITLREGIAAGDPCPVCGRKIAKLPAGAASPDLDRAHGERAAAQAALHTADAAAKAARDAAAHASATATGVAQQLEAATATLTATEAALAAATAALAAADDGVRALLGEGDAAQRLAALRASLAVAEAALETASRSAQTARAAEAAASAAHDAGRTALASLRVRLAMVAGTLGVEVREEDSPAAVRALLDGVRERWRTERAAVTERETAATAAAEAAAQRRGAALASGGVPQATSFDDAVGEAKQRVAVLDALIAEAERRIAEAADAEQQSQAIEARRTVYRRLSTDLTPSKFLNYLLEDERTSLAEIGSEWFERLSRGRYRFAGDGSFDVIDLTAAEHARRSSTLSGGETFLASLSLALALAEMVTQGGGRLDAFFLDEGFGSLDEEHLDLAMEGIERLVTESEDRLVVIVSHVPALRERIEDLVVLDRDPATGDTLVRRGAGASAAARAAIEA